MNRQANPWRLFDEEPGVATPRDTVQPITASAPSSATGGPVPVAGRQLADADLLPVRTAVRVEQRRLAEMAAEYSTTVEVIAAACLDETRFKGVGQPQIARRRRSPWCLPGSARTGRSTRPGRLPLGAAGAVDGRGSRSSAGASASIQCQRSGVTAGGIRGSMAVSSPVPLRTGRRNGLAISAGDRAPWPGATPRASARLRPQGRQSRRAWPGSGTARIPMPSRCRSGSLLIRIPGGRTHGSCRQE